MTAPIIQRIESFRCRRGQLAVERRNRGYTLYRVDSGTPVARLRPTPQHDRVEVGVTTRFVQNRTLSGKSIEIRDFRKRAYVHRFEGW